MGKESHVQTQMRDREIRQKLCLVSATGRDCPPYATRRLVAKTPYFLETISCLALTICETGDPKAESGP